MLGEPTVNTKIHIAVLAGVMAVATALPAATDTQPSTAKEYQLKAAFLFNFISFVDGDRFNLSPEEEKADKTKPPIVIGIVGKDPFGNAFDLLKGKEVRDRPVLVKRFKPMEELKDNDGHIPQVRPDLQAIKACHVLFICASEEDHLKTLLQPLRTYTLLTVGDVPGFLEAGGMIDFVIEDKKVRFDINSSAAARAKLEIRSKLLRLARTVKSDIAEEGGDGEKPAPANDK